MNKNDKCWCSRSDDEVAGRSLPDSTAASGGESGILCPTCGQGPFKNRRGLGGHVSAKHKAVANEAIDILTKRARWTEEEGRRLA